MKILQKYIVLFVFIGIFPICLTSCATKQYHLAVDASIISKGQTKDQVMELVGKPDYITKTEKGNEQWYYYNDITPFYKKIPFLGRLFGKREMEVIQVTFYMDRVSKVIYYVAEK